MNREQTYFAMLRPTKFTFHFTCYSVVLGQVRQGNPTKSTVAGQANSSARGKYPAGGYLFLTDLNAGHYFLEQSPI